MMARPISHERRSTERLCMFDTACGLAYAPQAHRRARRLFAGRAVRTARIYRKYAAAPSLSAIREGTN